MSKTIQAVQQSGDAAATLVNATASAVQGAGEGVKAVGHAVMNTASSVANSPTVGKVGGFLGDKFMQYWQAAEDITKTYVPKALEALLWVIRVDAISQLFYAVALIAAFYIAYRSIKAFWVTFDVRQKEAEKWTDAENAKAAKTFGSIVAGAALCTAIALTTNIWVKAFDVWTYVTIAKPELYLAKMAVDGGTAKIKEYVKSK
jgi:predicted small secreted protein